MPCCAVLTCKNKSGSHNLSRGGISYHRFPSDPETKAEWISATGRQCWIPGKTATICSIHFEPQDFLKKDGGRHYLYPVAIPSRNIFTIQENLTCLNDKFIQETATQNRINSIEVEITPENCVTVKSQVPQQYMRTHDTVISVGSSYPETHEADKKIIELMQTKIKEQDLLIRKLKVRNYRLKKRLFSLKSMEC